MNVDFKNIFYLKIEGNSRRVFYDDNPYYLFALYKTAIKIEFENGDLINVDPGDVVMIPPDIHFICLCEEGAYLHMAILFNAEKDFMDKLDIEYCRPIKLKNTEIISDLFFNISQQNISDSVMKNEMMNAYITEMLIHVFEETHTIQTSYGVKKGDDLQTVRMTVMESPGINWSIEKMANMANMSVRHFSRRYKQLYGKSPMSDLDECRFMKAKRLLETGFSINHILWSCGFKSPQYFSNFFKKKAGVTPREYVKMQKKSE